MTRRARSSFLPLMVVLALGVVSPSSSAAARPSTEATDAALARLAPALGLASAPSLLRAVGAASALTGRRVGVVDASAAPVPAGLPESLSSPVSQLLGAIETATQLAGQAVGEDPQHVQDQLDALLAQPRGHALGRASADVIGVDLSGLLAGAGVIAAAIDRAVPELLTASVEPGSGAAVGCDVHEIADLLCVAGDGANVIERDYALVVDLGGDDVHAHAAGGADPIETSMPVSVTIDLGGADRYAAEAPTSSGSRVVQGAGNVGGIGVLVDIGSDDDDYEASLADGPLLHAQGAGAAGVGILVDTGGNDTYLIENRSIPWWGPIAGVLNMAQYATGQGWGTAGIGIALDGGGDDTMTVRTAPTLYEDPDGTHAGPGAQIFAQAFGFGYVGGVGLLSHEGGDDVAELLAQSAPVAADDARTIGVPRGWAAGFGYAGFGGVGVMDSSDGNGAYSLESDLRAPQVHGSEASGFGVANVGGFAALHDAGGDDRYVARALSFAEQGVRIDDRCGCGGALARATALGPPALPDHAAVVRAHGYGAALSTGILVDRGGDDVYEADAAVRAVASVIDERESLAPSNLESGLDAHAMTTDAEVLAQGVGLAGTGILRDDAGRDTYATSTFSQAHAETVAVHVDPDRYEEATTGDAWTGAQAYGAIGGMGVLHDGGDVDTYGSVNTTEATSAGISSSGAATSRVQAAVDAGTATLTDVDDGQDDRFASVPENAACEGERGGQTWVDCGQGASLGANP